MSDTPKSKTVKLVTPIIKDGEEITEITLKKPDAGNLRGLSLVDVIEMKFDAMMILLPRISNLNERDLLNLEAENFIPLMTATASFFVVMDQ